MSAAAAAVSPSQISSPDASACSQLDSDTPLPFSSSSHPIVDAAGTTAPYPQQPQADGSTTPHSSDVSAHLQPLDEGDSPHDRKILTGEEAVDSTASSLSKARLHSVQKGSGIVKHANGSGRASKLAQLEVAAEHVSGTCHHALLTSPRLLRSPGRKKSPIRWFPRKKTESFLERKIRMLQEKEGKVASLDETLGAANLHLSRIEREKLAAQAAAAEAMNAKKQALVEASWCRLLKLAGIPCKVAILQLQKAEERAVAALTEAERHGVVLQHGRAERDATSDAITASLDTAFDVDKEVTAAIKVALKHISSCGQNQECSTGEISSEAESPSDAETGDDIDEEKTFRDRQDLSEKSFLSVSDNEKQDTRPKVENSLANEMADRISDLSLENQTALAGTVATHGLSALLKNQSLDRELLEKAADSSGSNVPPIVPGSLVEGSDLGSILVKHVSRLQREVQAAKETNSNAEADGDKKIPSRLQKIAHVESLDQILVKHVSKLEKEKLAAQASKQVSQALDQLAESHVWHSEQNESSIVTKEEAKNKQARGREKLSEVTNTAFCSTSLENILGNNHVSDFEKEKEQNVSKLHDVKLSADKKIHDLSTTEAQPAIMNELAEATSKSADLETETSGPNSGSNTSTNESATTNSSNRGHHRSCSRSIHDLGDLGSILVKHVSRLEKERQLALTLSDARSLAEKPRQPSCEVVGLGDMLVKKLSRLEIMKSKIPENQQKFLSDGISYTACGDDTDEAGKRAANSAEAFLGDAANSQKLLQMKGSWGGPSMGFGTSPVRSSGPRRRSLRERQLQDAWGGLSLGKALKPHLSKLEKEQAAWKRAEEEARRRPVL